MNRSLIERHIPGAGALTAAELCEIAGTSNAVLVEMPTVQWVESFVTADAITCHYLAESEEAVREHARRGGFPADDVRQVPRVIGPMTANATA